MPLYWLTVFPCARRELRRWREQAQTIPDATLRRQALHKLHTEHLTAEGAAAFAILAAARARGAVTRLCVAFEVMYDYLDALAEKPVANVLANNHALYRALETALSPEEPLTDYYAHHPQRDDGGYLRSLIGACREALAQLPAHALVQPALARLAGCAGEAQSLHHASSEDGEWRLREWAMGQQRRGEDGLCWWELAAGAGSPLGIFALAAVASRRATDIAAVARIECAYSPWIAALSWLLESLVDQTDDVGGGHSFVAHYRSPREAAVRLGLIATHAVADARRLPQATRHSLLLAGMVGMNLSHRGAATAPARDAVAVVRNAIGGPLRPLLAILRLRRALSGGERPSAEPGD